MKKTILVGIAILLSITTLKAQWCYDELKKNEEIQVKYKWKKNKAGEKELRIKFKSTAKSDLNTDLELGFYLNGVMEEKAQISVCLKKFFWNDWFRPVHLIHFETIGQDDIESDQFSIEILELKTEKVDQCIETDD